MVERTDFSDIKKLVENITNNSMVSYEGLPKYDLFLSQVIDFLNDKFEDDNYTNNIVQNYIKSEVISKPEDGKKRGYTKIHLVQLVLLSHMRPVLTTEEIKKVFRLAFNDINDRVDDIITWEDAYKMFSNSQSESLNDYLTELVFNGEKLDKMLSNIDLKEEESRSVRKFLTVMILIAQASSIKKLVQKIVNEDT